MKPRYTQPSHKCLYIDENGVGRDRNVYVQQRCCCSRHECFESKYENDRQLCSAILKSGKRKGEACGIIFCNIHILNYKWSRKKGNL